jgi:hypothetical protein
MGELKTRFMRGDRYGIRVVAWRVAELLHDLHNRTASFDGVSSEALDNPVWDDLVIAQGTRRTRWQVKRQMTPMGASELEPIVSGAQGILAAAPNGSENVFHIALRELVPVHFPQAKNPKRPATDLQLSHLQQLCTDAAVPGMQSKNLALRALG